MGGRWLCSSLGEKTAARKEGSRTVQPSRGQKPGLEENKRLWRGGESRTQGGPASLHPVQPSLGREVGRDPVTRRPFVLPAFCSRNCPFLTSILLLPGLIGIPSHPRGPRPGGLGMEGGVGQPHTGHPECQQTLASTSDPGPIPAWERSARDQKSEIRWSLAFLRALPAAKPLP